MKRILPLLLLLLGTTARGQAIFESIPFEQALDKARAAGKHVLVDCYTSWCGPCREMSEKVFPLREVGEYINPRFVTIKYDIEKDDDGKRLAREHRVTVIPTFLLFRPDGTLLHKFTGASDATRFTRRLEESFDGDRAYGVLRDLYDAGKGDRDTLAACLQAFTAAGDNDLEEMCARLLAQVPDEEKTTTAYWFIFASDKLSPPRSPNEAFLMDNAARFRADAGVEAVDKELHRRYARRLQEITRRKEECTPADLRALLARVKRLRLPGQEELARQGRVAAAVLDGRLDRLIVACERNLPSLPDAITRYIELSDPALKTGNARQKQRWLALGERIHDNTPADQQKRVEFIMTYLREHLLPADAGE